MKLNKSYLLGFAGIVIGSASVNAAVLVNWNLTDTAVPSPANDGISYVTGTSLIAGSSATLSPDILSVSDLVTVGTVQYSTGFPSGSDNALNLKALNQAGNYVEFTVTAASGYKIESLDSLVLSMYRNGTNAPATFTWEYQVDSGAWNTFGTVGGSGAINKGATGYGNVAFSPGSSLTGLDATAVSFRLYSANGYEGNGSGNIHINQLALNGATTPIPEPSTYAMLAGCVTLGLVILRRRKK